jgi:hypothetical protein
MDGYRHAPENLEMGIDEIKYTGQPLDVDIIIALTDNIEGRARAEIY